MMKQGWGKVLILSSVFLLSGCVVRSYQMTRERVDQDLTGNRGYIMGKAPAALENPKRKATRTTEVVEIELRSPLKFEKKTPPKAEGQTLALEGNKGFVNEAPAPTIAEQAPARQEALQKYTVQKGDTLQKISTKLYGTTKKWVKIFDINKDKLKAPNKIYPGQVIDVPLPSQNNRPLGLKETKGNLK